MKPLLHAENSAKKYGGSYKDYLPIHDFLDSTKSSLGDVRHRAILHNAFGVFIVEKIFGHYVEVMDLTRPADKELGSYEMTKVSVRDIAEDHIVEDIGYVPSIQDWLKDLPITDWMLGKAQGSAKRADPIVTATAQEIIDKWEPILTANSDGITAADHLDRKVTALVFDGCWPSEDSLDSNPANRVTVTEEKPETPSIDKTDDYLTQVEKYKEMKKAMSDSAKEVLTLAAEKFFKAVPEAAAISWVQFTPHFCDGDACVFSVGEPFVLTAEEDEDGIADEYETIFRDITQIPYYQKRVAENPDDVNYVTWLRDAIEGAKAWPGDPEKAAEAWSEFIKVFTAMDDDFMLDAFDDHMHVWIRPGGKVDTEEFEHD